MILDCTFRDGGYLNEWDWDIDLVKKTVNVLKNYVDIIELGYRSPSFSDKYTGIFKHCKDDNLFFQKKLGSLTGATCGVMVDISDYLNNKILDAKKLTDNFVEKKHSIFTYVRVATTLDNIKEAVKAVHILDSFGYKVMVSIMKRSTFLVDDIVDAYNYLRNTPMFAMYLADSFGAMTKPLWDDGFCASDIHLGVHCHNNLGTALINSYNHIYRTKKHIKFIVDASLMGIGRGAGNCDLVSLLLMLGKNPQPIIDLQNSDNWQSVKEKYSWGQDYLYTKSGVKNIHPKYVVEMVKKKISKDKIIKILDSIPQQKKHNFNKQTLEQELKNV